MVLNGKIEKRTIEGTLLNWLLSNCLLVTKSSCLAKPHKTELRFEAAYVS